MLRCGYNVQCKPPCLCPGHYYLFPVYTSFSSKSHFVSVRYPTSSPMPHALLHCYAAQHQAKPSAAGYHHVHISAAITATRTLHLSKRSLGDCSVLIGGVLRWTGRRVLALVLGPKAGSVHCQCHQLPELGSTRNRDLQLPAIQTPEHCGKDKEPDQNDAHGQHSAKGLQTLALKANGESFSCCYLSRLDISSYCPCICQRGRERHTRAVFGKTNENHVIWNGILLRCSGRMYFHSDPTDTRKNQMLSPHSQSPTM